MAKEKLKLRELRKINDALFQMESVRGLDITPAFNLSLLKQDVEKYVETFFKTRDKAFSDKKLESTEGMKEDIDFMYVLIKGNQFRIPVAVADIEKIDEDLEKQQDDQEYEIDFRQFKLEDFTQEVTEKDHQGKSVKKRVNLATPGILKGLSRFIEKPKEG